MFPNEHSKTEASCFVSRNESSFKYFKSATTPFFAQLSYVTSSVALFCSSPLPLSLQVSSGNCFECNVFFMVA